MNTNNSNGIGFAIDSNVFIDVISPQNVIRQTVTKHNKATRAMVAGILRFLRGEFNTTFKQTDSNKIIYRDEAKNFIPCYINIGTAGIRTAEDSEGYILPDYSDSQRSDPPLTEDWANQYVKFSQTNLIQEANTPRYEISVLGRDVKDAYTTNIGDTEQIVLHTEVSPNYYSNIYGKPTDIFVTEVGLYPSPTPNTDDMLAGVVLTKPEQVLYVRPQDTIVIRWIISIIALNDWSKTDTDAEIAETEIKAGTKIDDNIPFSGTIEDETTH